MQNSMLFLTSKFCLLTLCCTKTDTTTRHDTHFCCEGHSVIKHETLDVPDAKVTESQKRLVKKLHENTWHPPKDRFLRTLRAAGALSHVLKYVRDVFECEACAAKRLPDHRHKGQCPRVHAFNRVLSMDVFYVPIKGNSVPVLNVVCHGTNYLIVTIRLPTASVGLAEELRRLQLLGRPS